MPLSPEFKSRLKTIMGMVGAMMMITAIKEGVLPEYSFVPWLIIGFILLTAGITK